MQKLHKQYTHRPVHFVLCNMGAYKRNAYVKTWHDGSAGYVISLDDGKLYKVAS